MAKKPRKQVLGKSKSKTSAFLIHDDVELDLAGLGLASVPNDLPDLSKVEIVDISRNLISAIPEDLFQPPGLRVLLASNNRIRSIPPIVSEAVHLAELDLSHNALTDLPSEFGTLKHLRTLKLAGNRFKKIPVVLYEMNWLKTLDLDGNEITVVDEEIEGMSSLETLFLSGNEIRQLPNTFVRLRNLRTVALGNNQLKSLPPGLGEMDKLESFSFSGNKGLPSILSALSSDYGLSDLRTYLRGMRTNDSEAAGTQEKGVEPEIPLQRYAPVEVAVKVDLEDSLAFLVLKAGTNENVGHSSVETLHEEIKHRVLSLQHAINPNHGIRREVDDYAGVITTPLASLSEAQIIHLGCVGLAILQFYNEYRSSGEETLLVDQLAQVSAFLSIHTVFVRKFVAWRMFDEEANLDRLTRAQTIAIAELSAPLIQSMDRSHTLVDPQIPRRLQKLQEAVKQGRNVNAALRHGFVQSVQNALAGIAEFIVDVRKKIRENLVTATAAGLTAGFAAMLFGIQQSLVDLAASVPSLFGWLMPFVAYLHSLFG